MNQNFRILMGIAIVTGWICFYPYVVIKGMFNIGVFLPFQLCEIMEIIILIGLWKNDLRIFDKIIYPLILGPIIALSYPIGINSMGPIFNGYFVYYHLILLITGMYYLYLIKFRTNKKHVITGAVFIFMCDMMALVVNLLTKGNYMFIGEVHLFTPIIYYSILFLIVWMFLIIFHCLIKIFYHFTRKLNLKSIST